jgi:hypothetical protein
MKLSEIRLTGSRYTEYSEEQLASHTKHFAELPTYRKLPHDLEIKKDGDTNPFFALMRRGELIGWLKFKEVEIVGKKYHMLEVIYTQPKFRKTGASAYLILHMKDLSQLPIVLGDAYQHGGVLFKDGEDLLAALKKRPGLFDLSVMDLRTGEVKPMPEQLKSSKHTTVVIENCLPPGLNEQFALPHETGAHAFDERQDWLGDI